MTGAALYVHVPFCLHKCAYCDFSSVAQADERSRAAYLDAVRFHVDHWAARGAFEGAVPSLYFGGGTPTLLGDGLTQIVAWLFDRLDVAPGAEVTVETNPETTDPRLIAELVAAGVNRFSLGIQSFDEAALRYLDRSHDAATAEKAARVLADSGAPFSVDLICGIPGMSGEAWRETLHRAVATGASHMSVYPLTVEESTPLAAAIESRRREDTDPDQAAADMLEAARILDQSGFHRYEVANYARPGFEARHNIGYWTGVPYVGIGPSAAGMLPDGDGRIRFTYPRSLHEWLLAGPEGFETESLTAGEAAREDVMLRLRLTAGVASAQAESAGALPALEGLAARGLVERTGDAWRTTERGWLLGNEVFERVLFG